MFVSPKNSLEFMKNIKQKSNVTGVKKLYTVQDNYM